MKILIEWVIKSKEHVQINVGGRMRGEYWEEKCLNFYELLKFSEVEWLWYEHFKSK